VTTFCPEPSGSTKLLEILQMRFSKNQTSFSRAQFGFQKISQEFVAVFTVLLHDKTEVHLDLCSI
jgi:hypothetical protein